MYKGENIFKRKDGRWEARYIKGRDLSGKAKYGFCYGKTYKEAKDKVIKQKAAVLEGRIIPETDSRHRFAYYCDEWLQLRRYNIKESSYVKYGMILEKYIKPKLGACLPIKITSRFVDEFAHELLVDDKLASKSVHDILVVLHGILNYISEQMQGIFPTIKIHYPKEYRKQVRVLSLEEQTKFIKYLLTNTDACKFGVLLMLLTGVRIGELCALKWDDVDLKEHTICIKATLQRLHNTAMESKTHTHVIIGAPKSDTSVRTIPLSDYATKLCQKFAVKNRSTYILTTTDKYMEPRTLQYHIKKYTRDCDLVGVHAHTLRHTFATRAVEVGFEIKSLSEVLGHANTNITLQRYVHSSMELKKANMKKLKSIGL